MLRVVRRCTTSASDNASARETETVVLIAGAAANQDGRSSSLTAPNGPAQQGAIRAALASTASDGCPAAAPGDVSVLQMHGTGTALGDPIEVAGQSKHRLTRPLELVSGAKLLSSRIESTPRPRSEWWSVDATNRR
jgi:hypothetical protein